MSLCSLLFTSFYWLNKMQIIFKKPSLIYSIVNFYNK